MDFTSIANNVTVMYALFFIAVLLVYIAFFKDSKKRKNSR